MGIENSVVFKGRSSGITIVIDDSAKFDDVKETLRKKIIDAKNFFGNTKTAIKFSGRKLTDAEESQLLDIISKSSNLSISFVSSDSNEIIIEGIPTEADLHISADENTTLYHKGSLRSGQSIRFVGSIVIVGDVNPGAEIIAEGNIVVMGSVKGLVHAGCSGNADCFVSALNLQPTQLRIADIITYLPKDLSKAKKKIPSYAYVEKGQIFILPLVN